MPGTMPSAGQRPESGIATSSTRICSKTLQSLGKLPLQQRKVLLLAELSDLSMPEVGTRGRDHLPAGGELICRSPAPSSRCIGARPVRPSRNFCSRSMRWPRKPAGHGRRSCVAPAPPAAGRTPRIGIAAIVAALVIAGVVVSDGGTARPKLSQEQVTAGPQVIQIVEPPAAGAPAGTGRSTQPGTGEPTGPNAIWGPAKTHDNTAGRRPGAPLPAGTLRRSGRTRRIGPTTSPSTPARPRDAATSATQFTELSADDAAAATTYTTTLGWYAGCVTPRVQLLSTEKVGRCRRTWPTCSRCDPGPSRSRRTPSASLRPGR